MLVLLKCPVQIVLTYLRRFVNITLMHSFLADVASSSFTFVVGHQDECRVYVASVTCGSCAGSTEGDLWALLADGLGAEQPCCHYAQSYH